MLENGKTTAYYFPCEYNIDYIRKGNKGFYIAEERGNVIMNNIFIPAKDTMDLVGLLANKKHMKPGHSACAAIRTWSEAVGLPEDIRKVFNDSDVKLFNNAELLFAFPEYKVPIKGGRRASQNDIKAENRVVPVMVECKCGEDFGELVEVWTENRSEKHERLTFLLDQLGLSVAASKKLRYQLLHRSVSAIQEAIRIGSDTAIMLVQSFDLADQHFNDYVDFLKCLNINAVNSQNKIIGPYKHEGMPNLFFAWVEGNIQCRACNHSVSEAKIKCPFFKKYSESSN